MTHPTLVRFLLDSFVIVPWPAKTPSSGSASFGRPSKKVFKLYRVLSQASNKNAFTLLEQGLFGASLRYLVAVISKDPVKEPASLESLGLFLEVLAYWKIIMGYGYGMDAFTELLPLVTSWLKSLHEFNSAVKPHHQKTLHHVLYFEAQVMFFGFGSFF